MGKTNRIRKNREKAKTDPLGGVRNLDIGQHSALRETKILPVVKNLSSVETNKRIEAVSAIANLVEDETCRKLLLKERIVQALMERTLNDSSPEVVVRGWGALRNLAVEEGYDVCLHMYRKDILTPIAAAISKIQQTISQLIKDPASVDGVTKKLVWTYAENVVGLLTSISSETTEEVVTAVIKLNVLPFLMGLLSAECIVPRPVQSIAAQALNILTEDQEDLIKSIVESEEVFVPLLLQLRDAPASNALDPLLRTVAVCGVIHNISYSSKFSGDVDDSFSDSITLNKLTTIIEAAIKVNPPANGSTSAGEEPVTESERTETLQCALEIVASIVSAVQEAIDGELPLNGGQKEQNENPDFMDEDSDEDDKGEAEGDDDAVDDEMLEDMAIMTSGDHDSSPEPSSHSHSESIISYLISTTIPFLVPLGHPQSSSPILIGIQTRALTCLNNISWTCTTALSQGSSLFKSFQKHASEIWTSIIIPILSSNTASVELADVIAGLAWAVAKAFDGNVSLNNSGNETEGGGAHKGFMSIYNAATTDDLKTKCVGVLGCLGLAKGRVDVNKEIGVFLLTILNNLPPTGSTTPDSAVEALNALFDIYADMEYDYDEEVFVKCGFLEHLRNLLPRVRQMTKKIDKRKLPELRGRADEATENLRRFIDYKAKERK